LNLPDFDADLHQVLDNAHQHGIQTIVVPGVDLDSSKKAILLAEEYDGLYAAIGIHPNYANLWDKESYHVLKELCSHPKVVAVGEIGLDLYRDYVSQDEQMNALFPQLDLAQEFHLPIILHSRNAEVILLNVLKDRVVSLGAAFSGVFHAYEGDLSIAFEVIKMGFFIGVSGQITYTKKPDRPFINAALPISSLLLETDSPYLTPEPHRGKRNEPANIPIIANKICGLHNVEMNQLSKITTENAKKLFKLEAGS
jgi:TatD DNase family protein